MDVVLHTNQKNGVEVNPSNVHVSSPECRVKSQHKSRQ